MDAARRTGLVLIGRQREARLAEQMSREGLRVLFITDEELSPAGARVVHLPALADCQRVILEVVALQLLVRELAAARGEAMQERAFARDDTKIPFEPVSEFV